MRRIVMHGKWHVPSYDTWQVTEAECIRCLYGRTHSEMVSKYGEKPLYEKWYKELEQLADECEVDIY
jgi:hypothetical protein